MIITCNVWHCDNNRIELNRRHHEKWFVNKSPHSHTQADTRRISGLSNGVHDRKRIWLTPHTQTQTTQLEATDFVCGLLHSSRRSSSLIIISRVHCLCVDVDVRFDMVLDFSKSSEKLKCLRKHFSSQFNWQDKQHSPNDCINGKIA